MLVAVEHWEHCVLRCRKKQPEAKHSMAAMQRQTGDAHPDSWLQRLSVSCPAAYSSCSFHCINSLLNLLSKPQQELWRGLQLTVYCALKAACPSWIMYKLPFTFKIHDM